MVLCEGTMITLLMLMFASAASGRRSVEPQSAAWRQVNLLSVLHRCLMIRSTWPEPICPSNGGPPTLSLSLSHTHSHTFRDSYPSYHFFTYSLQKIVTLHKKRLSGKWSAPFCCAAISRPFQQLSCRILQAFQRGGSRINLVTSTSTECSKKGAPIAIFC